MSISSQLGNHLQHIKCMFLKCVLFFCTQRDHTKNQLNFCWLGWKNICFRYIFFVLFEFFRYKYFSKSMFYAIASNHCDFYICFLFHNVRCVCVYTIESILLFFEHFYFCIWNVNIHSYRLIEKLHWKCG